MEISQFTYFQQVGGLPCFPVMGELTYGLERLTMSLFNKSTVFDIPWVVNPSGKTISYGDVFHQNEVEMSHYHFDEAPVATLLTHFNDAEALAVQLLEKALPLPAYEAVIKKLLICSIF